MLKIRKHSKCLKIMKHPTNDFFFTFLFKAMCSLPQTMQDKKWNLNKIQKAYKCCPESNPVI